LPLLNSWTCIEVGSETWTIWQVNRKGNISVPERITMPTGKLWKLQTMANLLARSLSGRKILFLLNISSTIIKLSDSTNSEEFLSGEASVDPVASVTSSAASGKILPEDILTSFAYPIGKQSADYVFSHNIERDSIWMTAVPVEISNSLIKICRLKSIRPGRVKVIDTVEHRMACYLGRLYPSLWILLPQEPGIRLIVLREGAPCGCYFFSNHPDFRVLELTRLWMCQLDPPQYAVILDESPHYAWLRDFLEGKSVEFPEPGYKLDFRQAMIGEWIKTL